MYGCMQDVVFPDLFSEELHSEAHLGARLKAKHHPALVKRSTLRAIHVRVALILDLLQRADGAGHFLHLVLEQADLFDKPECHI